MNLCTDPASAALAAAECGWHVFPLAPDSKYPALHGQDDCPRTGPCTTGHLGWEQRATTDPGRIRQCWQAGPFGIGVATGPSGLVVIDLDTPKHPRDTPPQAWALPGVVDGQDVLAVLCERHGQPWPGDTFTVRTGRGGQHLYFTTPPGLGLRNTTGDRGKGLGWHIDTRAAGGYVVAAGSTVAHRPYAVVHNGPVAPLPSWLAALLAPAAAPAVPLDLRVVRARIGRPTAYADAALTREAAKVAAERAVGARNHTLFASAAALGRLTAAGTLSEELATAELLEAGLSIGLGEAECLRTIAKGLARGGNAVAPAA